MTDSSRGYIAGLHGLRAVACLGVFGVHLQQRTGLDFQWGPIDGKRLLLNGNTGVAFFFMLSGFLLSREIVVGARQPTPARSHFFARRAVRILPVYYSCLAALAVLSGHVQEANGWRDLVLHVLLIHNLRDDSFYALSSPFWTLAVQCQFYVLLGVALPWLFFAFKRWHKHGLAVLFLIFASCSYGAHVALMSSADALIQAGGLSPELSANGPVLTRSLLAHLPLFLLGAALGTISFDWIKPTNASAYRTVCDVITLGSSALLVGILGTPLDEWLQIPHGRYNLPYVPVLLGTILLAAPRSGVVCQLLEIGPIRSLGILSYCFYVFHEPCLAAVVRALNHYGRPADAPLVAAAGLALSTVASILVHALIERPALRAVNPDSAFLKGRTVERIRLGGKRGEHS
jgi:peptidoglycan/LPS O-acetylase OafA/YrhL